MLRRLADRCAYLPLGLRLVGELAANRPHGSVADELVTPASAETLDRLDAGGDEQTSLRAVFSWSYQQLPSSTARVFRLLGAHPGRTYDAYSVAALTGAGLAEADGQLQILRRAHLTEDAGVGLYTLHDLLHAYAIDLVKSEPEMGTAQTRLFDYLLWAATAAYHSAHTYDPRWLVDIPAEPPSPVPVLTDASRAAGWLEKERANLIAAARSATAGRHTIGIAAALEGHLSVSGYYPENIAMLDAALAAARRIGDAERRAVPSPSWAACSGRPPNISRRLRCSRARSTSGRRQRTHRRFTSP
jgi:hypothetical protein